MYLTVDHIAAVSHAEIALDGITVICGKNDTGKSTISRSLWCLFNGFSRYDDQVRGARAQSIERVLASLLGDQFSPFESYPARPLVEQLLSSADKVATDKAYARRVIADSLERAGDVGQFATPDTLDEAADRVAELMRVSDSTALLRLLTDRFGGEFHGQVSDLNADGTGRVELRIKEESYSATIEHDAVTAYRAPRPLWAKAAYIDDPLVLDRMAIPFLRWSSEDHQRDLITTMSRSFGAAKGDALSAIVADGKLRRVLNRMSVVVEGSVVPLRGGRFAYQPSDDRKQLDIRNISAGMKSFAVLKTLLQNGAIEQNGTVILDEPEVHLHPEWQLAYAEIVVLLHREFGLHVLLNTHSPYFLHAVEVYAAKHGVGNRCRYYAMRRNEGGCYAEDVTDSIEVIYRDMASPFAVLDDQVPEA